MTLPISLLVERLSRARPEFALGTGAQDFPSSCRLAARGRGLPGCRSQVPGGRPLVRCYALDFDFKWHKKWGKHARVLFKDFYVSPCTANMPSSGQTEALHVPLSWSLLPRWMREEGQHLLDKGSWGEKGGEVDHHCSDGRSMLGTSSPAPASDQGTASAKHVQ